MNLMAFCFITQQLWKKLKEYSVPSIEQPKMIGILFIDFEMYLHSIEIHLTRIVVLGTRL